MKYRTENKNPFSRGVANSVSKSHPKGRTVVVQVSWFVGFENRRGLCSLAGFPRACTPRFASCSHSSIDRFYLYNTPRVSSDPLRGGIRE